MSWELVLDVFLIIIILLLMLKIAMIYKSLEEIDQELEEKLGHDTNTLITVSGNDRRVKRLAANLNRQLRQLVTERRCFQNGNREIKEAITNISHDLRTPLTAICGYLDLIKQEEKSAAAACYLTVIENRTEAMKELTEELFRYSVTASTVNELTCGKVSLNGILEESIGAYYGALKGRGIVPEICMPNQQIFRKLDKNALARIFGNIISNALKYSDGDLRIRLSKEGCVSFSNRTAKLDSVTAGRLFNRFFTVESGKDSTGLGLSIAKLLTEALGGEISAEYEQGNLTIRVCFSEEKYE